MKATPQRHESSPGTRRVIVAMHKVGTSFAVIGRELEMPADTVRKIWKRHENEPLGISTPRSGRPPKLDDRDRRHIKRYVRNDRTKRREPLADISADLNLNVHSDTRKRVLKNAGLNHRIA